MKKVIILILCILPVIIWAEYAAMYIDDGAEQTGSPLFNSGTYYDVTGWGTSTTSTAWSYSSNALTNTNGGGLYYVKYSLSWDGSEGTWKTRILVNTTSYAVNERRMKLNADVGNISGGCLINIANGESLKLQVTSDDNVTSFTPHYAQVAIYEVTEASTPYYAEIYNTTSTTQSSIGTSWVDVTSYTSGELSGWTFASNTLTVSPAAAGTYYALLDVNMSSSSVNDFFTGISINDATPSIIAQRHVNGNSDFGNSLACGIITVSSGDEVSIKVKADGSNKNFTSNVSNFVLIPLNGSTSAPYTSMLTNNNTVSTSISGTWVSESNQVDDERNSSFWSFSSSTDTMTPIGDSAGKYLVSYYIGITYPNPGESGTDIDVDCGISIGNTIVEKTMIKRSLQKKDSGDFGSASGNAIVTIDSGTDVITLDLKEISSQSASVKVQYSNVTLVRIKEETSFTLPVTLSSFYGLPISNKEIELYWETATESDIYGYNIYRDGLSSGTAMELRNLAPIIAYQSNTGNSYTFIDEDFQMADHYFYWLESIELSGTNKLYGPFYVKTEFSDEYDAPEILPRQTTLANYPNPFNPVTEISFELVEQSDVLIEIFNLKGEKIFTKQLNQIGAGRHSIEWDAGNYSSGTYLIRMLTNTETLIRKATLLK